MLEQIFLDIIGAINSVLLNSKLALLKLPVFHISTTKQNTRSNCSILKSK